MTETRPDDLAVNLDNCAREPIHVPGAIQPRGVLLHLRPRDLRIVQVTANAAQMLGMSPESLVDRPLEQIVGTSTARALRARIDQQVGTNDPNPLTIGMLEADGLLFDAIVHNHDGAVLLELEPHDPTARDALMLLYGLVHGSVGRLQSARTVIDVASRVAAEVRAITDFDRVMVYRFDHDWSGHVIAEAKRDDLESFLGLHYPASDIPAQARRLYSLNWIRVIPTTQYEPSPLVPPLRPDSGGPLDLSFATLRSVSPIHLEYLGNMGSQATMTISLMDGPKLWGMIACHHNSPKPLPYPVRVASEFLGQVVSLHLTTKEDAEDADERVRIGDVLARMVEHIGGDEPFPRSLINGGRDMLDLVNATGCVIRVDSETHTFGRVPAEDRLDALIAQIRERPGGEDVFSTSALGREIPGFEDIAEVASGVLVITISRRDGQYVCWFREEVVNTVTWGGDPTKPVEVAEDGSQRLVPRGSFQEWKETVRQTASPWLEPELKAADELRASIRQLVLGRAEELAELNDELARSNKALDDFAHIASHDLREPLRGMSNYAAYLKEDYDEALDEDGVAKLDTLVRLTQRMEDLISSLLHFSQVGRTDLSWQQTDLTQLAQDTADLFSARLDEAKLTIHVDKLPSVMCDSVRVGEIFNNLISNAIKYRDGEGGNIWIGTERAVPGGAPEGTEPVPAIFVRDDGIGIREKHQDAIFRIFKRLHGRDKYGGGTGSGLTLAAKILERHGGRIWVRSAPGEGSTFYFTIGEEQ